ncbi:MAG: hypothetical protein COW00_00170 [Bdellovibrio sp. CG12_big_fil_rev_8_21_14_0_65_39_13]|nr:MAG: hypothetical protein COW78_19925 [Bdellovibrio sp. CG22_combo_CG10-13_8_21_14_all_39_27]PIQ62898.1 MAG: hypothetical protein COW00_00170 [Bdellovibrio sp. CG12_big_fil_rev_8_21_14_0_65_39_13]PIR33253.1 MAG: hypothetical protein COV37_16905 [Bdellovibrio sp. CG11_big_fil_rev_8_21_14_0_20_39_38]PJB52602.1 MAG: hypothetical protein CO099_11740 [Bdellovibrio sp. CG_4_9_14_3_um_filter_39_7]
MITYIVIGFISFGLLYQFILREKWRAYHLQRRTLPLEYEKILIEHFYPYSFLESRQQEKLKYLILYFLEYKIFLSIEDFKIEPFMKVLIAAHACLLILNTDEKEIYPDLTTIYISESTFDEKNKKISLQNMKAPENPRLGESWKHGPVIIAWDTTLYDLTHWKRGSNVLFHEFAHQLDGRDGGMDGTPILNKGSSYKIWQMVMSKHYLDLRNKALHHRHSDIDFYGTKNEAEFFAVTVEEFFQNSHIFSDDHPDLYELYKEYFRLDPKLWI